MGEKAQSESDGNSSRRGFLEAAIGVLAALMAWMLTWPLVSSVVGPAYQRKKSYFTKAAKLSDLPEGNPKEVTFPYAREEAFVHIQDTHEVWVILKGDEQVTVFSPKCPHMGCRYNWNQASGRFFCACHGSVFSITGAVLAGPSPRVLDTLEHQIEGDDLSVKWEEFKAGTAEKVRIS